MALRTDEPFFADADFRKDHTVNAYARFDIGIGMIDRSKLSLLVECSHKIP